MQKAIRLVTRFLAKCQKDKINAYSAQIAFFIILSIIRFLWCFLPCFNIPVSRRIWYLKS